MILGLLGVLGFEVAVLSLLVAAGQIIAETWENAPLHKSVLSICVIGGFGLMVVVAGIRATYCLILAG